VVGVGVVVEAVRVAAAVEEEGVAVGHELFVSVVVPCQGSFKWDQIFLEAIFWELSEKPSSMRFECFLAT
jgi:hypothetical protein